MTYPLKVKVTQYRANRLVVFNWINLSNGHFRGRIRGWVTRERYSFKGCFISRTIIHCNPLSRLRASICLATGT